MYFYRHRGSFWLVWISRWGGVWLVDGSQKLNLELEINCIYQPSKFQNQKPNLARFEKRLFRKYFSLKRSINWAKNRGNPSEFTKRVLWCRKLGWINSDLYGFKRKPENCEEGSILKKGDTGASRSHSHKFRYRIAALKRTKWADVLDWRRRISNPQFNRCLLKI